MADVDGQGRRDRVAETVGDWYPKRDARTRAPVYAVWKQVRKERRQDVLDGRVLVDVADDTNRLELTHLIGVRDRSAEDDDSRSMVELPNRLQKHDTVALRDAQIEDDQVDAGTLARTCARSSWPVCTVTAL